MYPDKNVLGMIHCAGGNSKRLHWDAEAVNFGMGYLDWLQWIIVVLQY